MAEEYTCIECECLYDDRDGDTDERMCNKCLNDEQRNPNIRRSSTIHYPDWDKKKKEYVVPPNKRNINEMNDAIKSTPEYKLGKELLSRPSGENVIKAELIINAFENYRMQSWFYRVLKFLKIR